MLLDGEDVTGISPDSSSPAVSPTSPRTVRRDGLVGTFSVEDNMVLNTFDQKPFARGPARNRSAVREHAERLVEQFDVRTPSVTTSAGNLSGGNQQKVIIAREFTHAQKLLIAAQPTRGLDVGSIQYIHRRIVEERDRVPRC